METEINTTDELKGKKKQDKVVSFKAENNVHGHRFKSGNSQEG